MVQKAITRSDRHLQLDQAHAGRLTRLDERAVEPQGVVQADGDWLIGHDQRQPNSVRPNDAAIPEQDMPTRLSDRWQRCAWPQAGGLVQSWYTRSDRNERQNPPLRRTIGLPAKAKGVVSVRPIEPSGTATFDFWLRISTLEAGKPLGVPLTRDGRAKEAMADFPKLCSAVTSVRPMNRGAGQGYATFVLERRGSQPKSKAVSGVAMGLVNLVSTSEGRRYGPISPQWRRRVERSAANRRRKQKLHRCLKRNRSDRGLPTVGLAAQRAEALARNEIGQALNQMIEDLPPGAAVAVERLTVKGMPFKSRQMNRAWPTSQLGYGRDKLKFKLDERGIGYRSVQAAYSSQQGSQGGFTLSSV